MCNNDINHDKYDIISKIVELSHEYRTQSMSQSNKLGEHFNREERS